MLASRALDRQQGNSLDRLVAVVAEGFFALAAELNKKLPMQTRTFLVIMVIEFAQLLSFPLNPAAAMPWGSSAYMGGFSRFLAYVSLLRADTTLGLSAFDALVAISVIWVVGFLLLVASVVRRALVGTAQSTLALRLLRFVALLSSTAFFLPITSVLTRALACPTDGSSGWLSTAWSCSSVQRIVFTVLIALLAIVFVAVSAFVLAVFYDRSPTSRSWSARSHGRVDVAVLAAKVAFAVLFNLVDVYLLGDWLLTALLLAAGLGWFLLSYWQMPLVHVHVNATQTGLALAFLWACAVLGLAQLAPTQDVFLLVYLGTPVVFVAGGLVAYFRMHEISRRSLLHCTTLSEVDVWARARMQRYAQLVQDDTGLGHGSDRHHLVGGEDRSHNDGSAGSGGGGGFSEARGLRNLDARSANERAALVAKQARQADLAAGGRPDFIALKGAALLPRNPGLSNAGSASGANGAGGTGSAGGSGGTPTKGAGGIGFGKGAAGDGATGGPKRDRSSRGVAGSVALDVGSRHRRASLGDEPAAGPFSHSSSTSFASSSSSSSSSSSRTAVSGSVLDVEEVLAMASGDKRALRDQFLREAERGYKYAMERFGNDEMAYILASTFFRDYTPHNVGEATTLALAQRRLPALDIRVHIYERVRELRSEDAEGTTGHLDRVLFDQQWREVSDLRVEAYRNLILLWDSIASPLPDLDEIQSTGSLLQRTLERIETLYFRMLRVNRDSASLLRAYATHLMELQNEPVKAMELVTRADRIEEAQSRQRTRAVRHIVFGTRLPSSTTIDEASAVVTFSAFRTSLGEILSASPAACRLFGLVASQLVGQNISVVLPRPLRESYAESLRRAASFESSEVVGSCRLVAAQTKQGGIVPVWLSVVEAPPEATTCEPRFTAIMEPIATDENHIFFGGSASDFRVFAASASSLALLGLDREVVQADSVSMLQWFPSLDPGFRSHEVTLTRAQISFLQSAGFVQDLELPASMRPKGSALNMGFEGSFHSALRLKKTGTNLTSFTVAAAAALAVRGSRLRLRATNSTASLPAPDPDAGVRVSVMPLLALTAAGIVPVQMTTDGERYLVGSVQHVSMPYVDDFFVLRWHRLQGKGEESAPRRGLARSRSSSSDDDSWSAAGTHRSDLDDVLEEEDGARGSDSDSTAPVPPLGSGARVPFQGPAVARPFAATNGLSATGTRTTAPASSPPAPSSLGTTTATLGARSEFGSGKMNGSVLMGSPTKPSGGPASSGALGTGATHTTTPPTASASTLANTAPVPSITTLRLMMGAGSFSEPVEPLPRAAGVGSSTEASASISGAVPAALPAAGDAARSTELDEGARDARRSGTTMRTTDDDGEENESGDLGLETEVAHVGEGTRPPPPASAPSLGGSASSAANLTSEANGPAQPSASDPLHSIASHSTARLSRPSTPAAEEASRRDTPPSVDGLDPTTGSSFVFHRLDGPVSEAANRQETITAPRMELPTVLSDVASSTNATGVSAPVFTAAAALVLDGSARVEAFAPGVAVPAAGTRTSPPSSSLTEAPLGARPAAPSTSAVAAPAALNPNMFSSSSSSASRVSLPETSSHTVVAGATVEAGAGASVGAAAPSGPASAAPRALVVSTRAAAAGSPALIHTPSPEAGRPLAAAPRLSQIGPVNGLPLASPERGSAGGGGGAGAHGTATLPGSPSLRISLHSGARGGPAAMAAAAAAAGAGAGATTGLAGPVVERGSLGVDGKPKAGRYRDGAGSVNSTGTQVVSQLIRAITQMSQTTEPEVRRMRWVLVGIVGIVVAAAVSQTLVWNGFHSILTRMQRTLWLEGFRFTSFDLAFEAALSVTGINSGLAIFGEEREFMNLMWNATVAYQNAQERLYVTAEGDGDRAFEYASRATHVIVEPGLAPGVEPQVYHRTVAEFGAFMGGILNRLARSGAEDLTVQNYDLQLLMLNSPAFLVAMNESLQARHSDLTDLFPLIQSVFFLGGAVFLVAILVATLMFFILPVRSLGNRSVEVLLLFLHIPSRVAKSMKKRMESFLSRLLEEENEGDGVEDTPRVMDEFDEAENAKGRGRHAKGKAAALADDMDPDLKRSIMLLKRSTSNRHGDGGRSRPYRVSSRFVWCSVAKLQVPVVFMLGWMVFLVVFQIYANQRVERDMHRMILSLQSEVLVPRIVLEVSNLVTAPPEGRASLKGRVRDLDEQLYRSSQGVLHGGKLFEWYGVDVDLPGLITDASVREFSLPANVVGRLSTLSEEVAVLEVPPERHPMLSDGTTASMKAVRERLLETSDFVYDLYVWDACKGSLMEAECRSVENGVLSRGIFSGVVAFLDIVRDFLRSIPSTSMHPDLVQANPEALVQILRMAMVERPHLREAFSLAALAFQERSINELQESITTATTVTWVFAGCFIVVAFSFYWPVIASLSGPLRSARSLLGLIPSEMVEVLPALRLSLQQIATDVHIHGMAGGHGAHAQAAVVAAKSGAGADAGSG